MDKVKQLRQELSFRLRLAEAQDLPWINQILRQARLPVEGVKEHLDNFLVGLLNQRIIATCGLEIYGTQALVRSLAVIDEWQGLGLGRKLLSAVVDLARRKGVKQVYLLTETAETFFTRFGFTKIEREEVRGEVTSSLEFSRLCPVTATCMILSLTNSSPEGGKDETSSPKAKGSN